MAATTQGTTFCDAACSSSRSGDTLPMHPYRPSNGDHTRRHGAHQAPLVLLVQRSRQGRLHRHIRHPLSSCGALRESELQRLLRLRRRHQHQQLCRIRARARLINCQSCLKSRRSAGVWLTVLFRLRLPKSKSAGSELLPVPEGRLSSVQA